VHLNQSGRVESRLTGSDSGGGGFLQEAHLTVSPRRKDNAEDATEEFQEIGSAYNTILKHLEGPSHDWADNGDEGGIYYYHDDYHENNMGFCCTSHSSRCFLVVVRNAFVD